MKANASCGAPFRRYPQRCGSCRRAAILPRFQRPRHNFNQALRSLRMFKTFSGNICLKVGSDKSRLIKILSTGNSFRWASRRIRAEIIQADRVALVFQCGKMGMDRIASENFPRLLNRSVSLQFIHHESEQSETNLHATIERREIACHLNAMGATSHESNISSEPIWHRWPIYFPTSPQRNPSVTKTCVRIPSAAAFSRRLVRLLVAGSKGAAPCFKPTHVRIQNRGWRNLPQNNQIRLLEFFALFKACVTFS